jgi:protein ImuB
MARFVSLSLPFWPTQRPGLKVRPASPDKPFALHASGPGGERLRALDRAALDLGLHPGQSLSDARALEPALVCARWDETADRRALEALARWCGRWSPWTAPDPAETGQDGVLIDITGCAHLFGGEAAMLSDIRGRLDALGLTAFAAAAPTLGLAWALARHAAPFQPHGWFIAADTGPLADMPVEGLRIGQTAAALRRFGLKTAGDLAALPRGALARRFGPELLRRLDQASGRERESLGPLSERTVFRTRVRVFEPLMTRDAILRAAHQALGELCDLLEDDASGAARARLSLWRVDGRIFDIDFGFSTPSRDPAHMGRVMAERMARCELDIGFGIDLVECAALTVEPVAACQARLDGAADRSAEMARLSDRLAARLGAGAVKRAASRQSHVPERAAGWRPGPSDFRSSLRSRPLLLLARPEPAEAVAEIPDGPPRSFTWRRVRHRVRLADGPERIAPEWWRETGESASARTRDYFSVETEEGRRFWVFREGLYGLEPGAPRWFVHGAG